MTIDELSIVVSVAAQDALETLDELEKRLDEVCGKHIGGEDGGSLASSLAQGEAAAWALRDVLTEAAAAASGLFSQGTQGSGSELLSTLPDLLERIALANEHVREGMESGGLLDGMGAEGLSNQLQAAESELRSVASSAAAAAAEAQRLGQAYDWAGSSMEQNTQRGRALLSAYEKQANIIGEVERRTQTLTRGQQALNAAKQDGTSLSRQEEADIAALCDMLGYHIDLSGEQQGRYAMLSQLAAAYAASIKNEMGSAVPFVTWLSNELLYAAACSNINASVRVDCSSAVSNIQVLISRALEAFGLLNQLGTTSTSGSSGARRSVSPVSSTPVSSAPVRTTTTVTKTAYEKAMEDIRHLKALDKLTYEQELARLEVIRKKYKLSADERKSLAEDIYDVTQAIRERDAAHLDTVTDGLVTALKERYEGLRDAQIAQLDESKEAWEDWRNKSVAAVEEQIAALDKLKEAQSREKKDEQELRAIEKLRREMEYEQDEYNRLKLQKQLEAAVESREERLKSLELKDQKEALKQEIEAINERAQAETDALSKEQERIEAAYAERLKAAALEAEAEKLLMQGTQEEIIDLLGAFAPDYNLTGQTLGERLASGFEKKVGSIIKWFEGLSERMQELKRQASALAMQTSDTFTQAERAQSRSLETAADAALRQVVVNQTTNINQPVETPGEYARRMARLNEALADELLRGA